MSKKNTINVIPDFRIKIDSMGSNQPIDYNILDIESFHRRIMHFVLDRMYGDDSFDNNILCYLVDEDGNKYTTTLEKDGYSKALTKSLEYFLKNENYENCIIIKKLLKLI